jgi:hypothetical protein
MLPSRASVRLAIAFLFLAIAPAALTSAGDAAELRVEFGARIFRALLAADVDLPKKAAGTQLVIVFFYRDDATAARDLAARFTGSEIRGLSIATEVTNDPARISARGPAAIFLCQPSRKDALQSLVKYGIDHRVIVYSPFEGDVENGVLGGLSIEAQVRPYVNASTLDASKINLKSLFLQVAKVYR